MASGPEHYQEAEKLLRQAKAYNDRGEPAMAEKKHGAALIHAILAQTAATATLAGVTAETTGTRHTDADAWGDAIKPSAPVDSAVVITLDTTDRDRIMELVDDEFRDEAAILLGVITTRGE